MKSIYCQESMIASCFVCSHTQLWRINVKNARKKVFFRSHKIERTRKRWRTGWTREEKQNEMKTWFLDEEDVFAVLLPQFRWYVRVLHPANWLIHCSFYHQTVSQESSFSIDSNGCFNFTTKTKWVFFFSSSIWCRIAHERNKSVFTRWIMQSTNWTDEQRTHETYSFGRVLFSIHLLFFTLRLQCECDEWPSADSFTQHHIRFCCAAAAARLLPSDWVVDGLNGCAHLLSTSRLVMNARKILKLNTF